MVEKRKRFKRIFQIFQYVLILFILLISVYVVFLFLWQVDYQMVEEANPELLYGVNAVLYINHSLYDKAIVGNFRKTLGVYYPILALIRINVNNKSVEEIKSVLCHELCHHQWYTNFTQKDRDKWENNYLEWNQSSYEGIYRNYIFDGNELHSYWCGENYQIVCYND